MLAKTTIRPDAVSLGAILNADFTVDPSVGIRE